MAPPLLHQCSANLCPCLFVCVIIKCLCRFILKVRLLKPSSANTSVLVFSLLTVGLKWQKYLKAVSKFMVAAIDRNKSSRSTLQHCQQPHCKPPVAVLSHFIKSTRASASHCCREMARNPAARNSSFSQWHDCNSQQNYYIFFQSEISS